MHREANAFLSIGFTRDAYFGLYPGAEEVVNNRIDDARATLRALMKAAANSVFLSQKEIQARVAEIGREISQDYAGRALTVIGVLKGSFIFVADLVRQIDPSIPIEI